MQINKTKIQILSGTVIILSAVFLSGFLFMESLYIAVLSLCIGGATAGWMFFAVASARRKENENLFSCSESDEQSFEGIYFAAADGSIKSVNRTLNLLLDPSFNAEFSSGNLNRFDLAADIGAYNEFLDKLFSYGTVTRASLELKCSSSKSIPVLERAVLSRDSRGRVLGWHGRIFDLSAEKLAAFKLDSCKLLIHSFIDTSDLIIAAVSCDEICLIANTVFASFFGLGSAELCEGRAFADLLSPQSAEKFSSAVQVVLSKKRLIETFEMNIPDCRSQNRIFSVRMSAFYDSSGKIGGVIFLGRDISVRREAERRAQVASEKFHEAMKLRSELVEQISHELRTPLSGIAGAFQVLKSSCRTPEAVLYAERGLVATKRLNEVLKEILSLSEEDGLDAAVSRVDPSKVASSVFEAFRPYATEKGIELQFHQVYSPDFLYCNSRRLRLAFFRFIGHILSLLDKPGDAVFILGRASSLDDCHALEFFFSDLINSYKDFEDDALFPDSFDGLAGTLGAEVFVRTRDLGRDIGFKIGCMNIFSAHERTLHNEKESLKRVLLAEDDINSQARMRIQLEKWGYSVRSVSTGYGVLQCLKEDVFDILMLDIQMPEMDGFKALQIIRSEESSGSHLPIICMSAYEGDTDKILENGADYFLPKPVETSTLKGLLDEILDKE